jgi:uncharacterized protein (DUF305 family)
MSKSSILSLIVGLLILSACKATASLDHANDPMIHHDHSKSYLSELEALYWARIDSSRMNFVQADVDFMTDMIVHHAQALIMSRLAPTNQASHTVQTLAARIINAQQDEIATMQKWLRDRGQAVPLVSFNGLVMIVEMEEAPKHTEQHHGDHQMANSTKIMDHHANHTMSEHQEHSGHSAHSTHFEESKADHSNHSMHETTQVDHSGHGSMNHDHMAHHHDMPGMLTQEQLDYLATLRGSEFDRYFLTFMIEHHKGAVYMVNELFAADGAANDEESYRLAVDIYAEQVTEIEMMKLMLEDIPILQPAHHQH